MKLAERDHSNRSYQSMHAKIAGRRHLCLGHARRLSEPVSKGDSAHSSSGTIYWYSFYSIIDCKSQLL